MSFINPSDMVEEDAADLQFPKGNGGVINLTTNKSTKHIVQYYCTKPLLSSSSLSIDLLNRLKKCNACGNYMTEPYIKCAECKIIIELCLKCFSRGKEIQNHLNTHSYIIIHDNINVFPNCFNWTAKDEKLLLNLIQKYGIDNWSEISKRMLKKNEKDCREHYYKYYFDGIFKELLDLTNFEYYKQMYPLLCKLRCIEPPRYDDDIDSLQFKNMAGYRAARGDFDIPYDNSAESILCNLNLNLNLNDYDDDDECYWSKENQNIIDELNCAMFKAYNHRLKERKRRYEIMKNHGLITPNKNHAYIQKYSEALQTSSSSHNNNLNKLNETGRFVSFMQITNGIAFDYLIEGLQLFTDYKKYLLRLYDLRKNGIITIAGAKIYNKLKHKRLIKTKNKKIEQYENLIDWKQLGSCINRLDNGDFIVTNSFNFAQKRRKAAPLDIIELPGYSQLNDDERNLCSRVRITPMAYQEYKTIFQRENLKFGFLRLADARRLIKIDVNKTRQIYDFLIEQGCINKPHDK